MVRPGATTLDLERVAETRIAELGAKPAFKGYHGYPCVLCTSVNSEVVHGIPSKKRVLKEGDIVSVDCGAIVDGYYGDAAITVPVGEKIDAGHGAAAEGNGEVAALGHRRGEAGSDAGRYRRCGAEGGRSRGILGGTGFCGPRDRQSHARRSAGAELWRSRARGMKLRAGMVIAIEPMVNAGKPDVRVLARRLDGGHRTMEA